MKSIALKLYTFHELESIGKQHALTTFAHTNSGFNWWNGQYDDFVAFCSEIGIRVDRSSIRFRGFGSPGDGSAFSAAVDLARLVQAIPLQPSEPDELPDFQLPAPDADHRVLKLLSTGAIASSPCIIAGHRRYEVFTDLMVRTPETAKPHPLMLQELARMEEWLIRAAQTLNALLYQSLQAQYERLLSGEYAIESSLFNEYLFTADGRTANYLLELAEQPNKIESR